MDDGFKVIVGSDAHVMEKEHHIQWIEIIADGLVFRKFLKPGDFPQASFKIDAQNVQARAYCTQHGLCVERQTAQVPRPNEMTKDTEKAG